MATSRAFARRQACIQNRRLTSAEALRRTRAVAVAALRCASATVESDRSGVVEEVVEREVERRVEAWVKRVAVREGREVQNVIARDL